MSEQSHWAPVTGRDAARQRLRELHRVLGSWRAVGDEIGIPPGTACRVAKGGYWPKRKTIRELLVVQRRPRKPKTCPKCGAEVN